MNNDPLWEVKDLKNADNDPNAPRYKPHWKKYQGKKVRKCDCHVSVDYSRGSPVIKGCPNEAKFYFYPDEEVKTAYLTCETCLPRLEESYKNKVNWSKIARAAYARLQYGNEGKG